MWYIIHLVYFPVGRVNELGRLDRTTILSSGVGKIRLKTKGDNSKGANTVMFEINLG